MALKSFVRVWHGDTRRSVADEYEGFLVERTVPDYESMPGLRKVISTRRDKDDVTHFLLIAIWDSIEAMRCFTGGHPWRAKYHPEDDHYLLEKKNTYKYTKYFTHKITRYYQTVNKSINNLSVINTEVIRSPRGASAAFCGLGSRYIQRQGL